MAANLEFEVQDQGPKIVRTLTYHEDRAAGALVKLEVGTDELSETVPAGKAWNVQVTILVTETDA